MNREGRNLNGVRRNGFTLIEIVIVIMIIALFAGLIIPRMASLGKRNESLTVDKVADLLSAFSYRDSVASGSTAIEFVATDNSLLLLALQPDPLNPEDPRVWSRDYLAAPVDIPSSLTLRALQDGKLLPDSNWSILTNSDGTRPKIEMELQGDLVDASIVLDPWAPGPYVVDNTRQEVVLFPDVFDLDAAGQDREPW